VFNWVCMILLLEKSIHVITALFQPWWPFAQAANRYSTKFREAAKFVPVPGLDWAKKTRSLRLVAGGERLGPVSNFG